MDIRQKCDLLTNNRLFNKVGIPCGNDEIDLEIYNEIKDEITKKT